jgi:hypothetical protein
MNRLSFLFLLCLNVACDPWGFGFKKNPAYVLTEAFEAVLAGDPQAFNLVTGREALCLYGNDTGLDYLRRYMDVRNPDDVEIHPKLIENSSRYTKNPQFVGYWSYFHERYILDILDKKTKEELLKVVVECHYGMEGQKSEKYQNMKVKKYKKKECRLIKLMPSKFDSLPMNIDCMPLRVNL